MRWFIGILVALNLFVFALANLNDGNNQENQQVVQIGENVRSINLLDSTAPQLPGNCSNVGPIEQKIVLDRFEKVLAKQTLSYRILSESGRKVAAYRVIIPIGADSNVADMKQRLNTTGIEESYEKTMTNGEKVLSLGVFTYKDTATELTENLVTTGFSASTEREFLQYPQRYWLNLDESVDDSVITAINQYTGQNKLRQSPAKCL